MTQHDILKNAKCDNSEVSQGYGYICGCGYANILCVHVTYISGVHGLHGR